MTEQDLFNIKLIERIETLEKAISELTAMQALQKGQNLVEQMKQVMQ